MSDLPHGLMEHTESFVRHIKDALEDLYDFAALERHPFARLIATQRPTVGETSGQSLRRYILEAIDALNPGSVLTHHEPQSRSYDLLRLRYVEGMRIQEAADELGISERQAYRHLREAIDALASVIWSRHANLRQIETAPTPPAPSADPQMQPTDLTEMVAHAVNAVARLAETRGAAITVAQPAHPVVVATNPTMAKQVLVSLVSQCIQQTQHSDLALSVGSNEAGTTLAIEFTPISNGQAVITPVVEQLVHQLGWSLSLTTGAGGTQIAQVQISASFRTLLVIDDEEGLGKLIERYLTDLPFQVVIANSGPEGLELAQELQPAALVLDVMMPGMDGWEVLQRLRTNPRTRDMIVIVCSIFNDPELADSLGAQMLLPKPLNPKRLFEVLGELGVL